MSQILNRQSLRSQFNTLGYEFFAKQPTKKYLYDWIKKNGGSLTKSESSYDLQALADEAKKLGFKYFVGTVSQGDEQLKRLKRDEQLKIARNVPRPENYVRITKELVDGLSSGLNQGFKTSRRIFEPQAQDVVKQPSPQGSTNIAPTILAPQAMKPKVFDPEAIPPVVVIPEVNKPIRTRPEIIRPVRVETAQQNTGIPEKTAAQSPQLTVGLENDEVLKLDVQGNDTIFSVKEQIEDKTGTPIVDQILIYAGTALDNSRTLESYNYPQSAQFPWYLKIRGGRVPHYVDLSSPNERSFSEQTVIGEDDEDEEIEEKEREEIEEKEGEDEEIEEKEGEDGEIEEIKREEKESEEKEGEENNPAGFLRQIFGGFLPSRNTKQQQQEQIKKQQQEHERIRKEQQEEEIRKQQEQERIRKEQERIEEEKLKDEERKIKEQEEKLEKQQQRIRDMEKKIEEEKARIGSELASNIAEQQKEAVTSKNGNVPVFCDEENKCLLWSANINMNDFKSMIDSKDKVALNYSDPDPEVVKKLPKFLYGINSFDGEVLLVLKRDNIIGKLNPKVYSPHYASNVNLLAEGTINNLLTLFEQQQKNFWGHTLSTSGRNVDPPELCYKVRKWYDEAGIDYDRDISWPDIPSVGVGEGVMSWCNLKLQPQKPLMKSDISAIFLPSFTQDKKFGHPEFRPENLREIFGKDTKIITYGPGEPKDFYGFLGGADTNKNNELHTSDYGASFVQFMANQNNLKNSVYADFYPKRGRPKKDSNKFLPVDNKPNDRKKKIDNLYEQKLTWRPSPIVLSLDAYSDLDKKYRAAINTLY